MVITKKILDELTEKAKASPRLRMNLDLRDSDTDGSQRMLNALEPGTVMPIHRHHASSETVVILRGKVKWVFFDDNDNLRSASPLGSAKNPNEPTEEVILDANGEVRMLNVERDRWHSLVCLEDGSVLYESKNGAYQPLAEDEIWNPENI